MSKYRFGFDFQPDPVGGGGGSGGSQAATPVGYVDQITDKNGDLYDIHDTGARSSITTLQNNAIVFDELAFNCDDYDTSTDVFSSGMAQQTFWHNVYLKLLRSRLDSTAYRTKDTAWAAVKITHRIYDMGEVTNTVYMTTRVPISFSDCWANSSTATSGYLEIFFVFYNPMSGKWSKVTDRITVGSNSSGTGDSHNISYSELVPSGSGPNTYVIEYNRTQTNHSVVSINGKTATADKITELRKLIADCTSTTQPIVCINYLDTSSSTTNAIRVRVNANVSPITANDVGFEFITTVFPSSGADVPSSAKYNHIRLTISGSTISDNFSSKTVSLS